MTEYDDPDPEADRDPAQAAKHAERRLFRAAVRDVKPHAQTPSPPAPPKPRAQARFTRLDAAAVLAESLQPAGVFTETGEEVSFKRTGVQDSVVAKLRRGQYRIEAEIDLHGLNAGEAKQALREFLQAARRGDARCVRVIHGKGRRSGHRGPVLKSTVQLLLQKVDAVLAYVSARQVDGGTGALYVLLERSRG